MNHSALLPHSPYGAGLAWQCIISYAFCWQYQHETDWKTRLRLKMALKNRFAKHYDLQTVNSNGITRMMKHRMVFIVVNQRCTWTMDAWPSKHAARSGVELVRVVLLTSAPQRIRNLTMSKCPAAAAHHRAGAPSITCTHSQSAKLN